MPLHETQIKFIESLIDNYVELTATNLETLKPEVEALNILCLEAVNRDHTLPVREKKENETLDQYQLYLMLADPCTRFLGLETEWGNAAFLVSDVQAAAIESIDTSVFEALVTLHYSEEFTSDAWSCDVILQKDIITEAIANNQTNKKDFISQTFVSDPYVANSHNWDLLKLGDMYDAKIVQTELSGINFVTENGEERAVPWVYPILNLVITIHIPSAPITKTIDNFMDFPKKETSEENDAEQIRIINYAIQRAELVVAHTILGLLGIELINYREAHNLLTYQYYFNGVTNQTIPISDFNNMLHEEVLKLRSRTVIALLQNNICDIKTARQLSRPLISLLQIPYYKDLIIQNKMALASLYILSKEQIRILRLPSIVNLQIRNTKITFDFAKHMSQSTANLLTDSHYFDRAADNIINIAALQKISDSQKNALLRPDIMKTFFEDDTGLVLRMLLDANYCFLYNNDITWLTYITTFTKQQRENILLFGITYLIATNKLTLETALTIPQWQIDFISHHSKLIWQNKISIQQCLFINEQTAQEFYLNEDNLYQVIKRGGYDYNNSYSLVFITWAVHFFIRFEEFDNNPHEPIEENDIQRIKTDVGAFCDSIPNTDYNETEIREIFLSEIMRLFLKKMAHKAQTTNARELDGVIAIIQETNSNDSNPEAGPRHQRWLYAFNSIISMTNTAAAPNSTNNESKPEKRKRSHFRFFGHAGEDVAANLQVDRSVTALYELYQSFESPPEVTHQTKKARSG